MPSSEKHNDSKSSKQQPNRTVQTRGERGKRSSGNLDFARNNRDQNKGQKDELDETVDEFTFRTREHARHSCFPKQCNEKRMLKLGGWMEKKAKLLNE